MPYPPGPRIKLCELSRAAGGTYSNGVVAEHQDCPLALRTGEMRRCPCRKLVDGGELLGLTGKHMKPFRVTLLGCCMEAFFASGAGSGPEALRNWIIAVRQLVELSPSQRCSGDECTHVHDSGEQGESAKAG